MYTRVQLTIKALLNVLSMVQCAGVPPIAGKCRELPYVKVSPNDFVRLAAITQWDIVYATDIYPYNRMILEQRDFVYGGGTLFQVTDTRYFVDRQISHYRYNVTYDNFVGYESAEDDNGVYHEYRLYVVAVSEDSVLYYRCSDTGHPLLDTRLIEVARGKQISDASLQYLLEEDGKFGFSGRVLQLPVNGQ